MKLLLASLIWCPEGDGYKQRAEIALQHVKEVFQECNSFSHIPCDHIIINNNIQNTYLNTELSKFPIRQLNVVPERDWAGARNTLLDIFINENYTHVIFFDADAFMEKGWLSIFANIAETCPNIHALTEDSYGTTDPIEVDGRYFYAKSEFFGLVNFLSRHAIDTIGGFDCINFHRYGYQDIEYGQRLKYSGLLSSSGGRYLSAFSNPLCFRKDSDLTPEEVHSRHISASHNGGALSVKIHALSQGQQLYFDYNELGPIVERI